MEKSMDEVLKKARNGNMKESFLMISFMDMGFI